MSSTVKVSSQLNPRPQSAVPENEAERLAAVRRYDVLDTPPDGEFDRIAAIAARLLDVPISIISIVDEDRIWFKSRHGVDVEQIGRDPGLCASAILSTDPYIIADAKTDPRALANPLVAGAFGLRFYMGVPLTTREGYNLGTLCVIDKVPRSVDQKQIDYLKDLASLVMDQMELRLAARIAVAHSQLLAREIDHRVMNSLQFVSGLLAMQSRAQGTSSAELQAAATRVAAVARVHRHFYTEAASEVSCIAFLRRLGSDLSEILFRPIEVSGDEANVPSPLIQPIGLIVNELVTNAAKHGAGSIQISYRCKDGAHELSVSDEGEGLPAGFDVERSTGLGMRVINSLARQLNGSVVGEASPAGRGARITVRFSPLRTEL